MKRKEPFDRHRLPDDLEVLRRSSTARDLEVRVEQKAPNHLVLHVANEFVAQNRYLLDETLERLACLRPGMRVEIEMSRVPFADSEALGRLQSWSKRLSQAGALLVVVNPTPYLLGIVETLRLDASLVIVHRHGLPASAE